MIEKDDGTAEIRQWLSERDTRPVDGRLFPVLRGWADLIRSWECWEYGEPDGDEDKRPSSFGAWTYFRTDPIVDDEMMALCDSHPGIAAQISDMVAYCEQQFGRLVRYPKAHIRGEESDSASARQKRLVRVASSNLTFGIVRLRARIDKAMAIIDRVDDAKPRLSNRQAEVLEIIREHQPIMEEGIRKLLKRTAAGEGTIRAQDIPILKKYYGVISTSEGYRISA